MKKILLASLLVLATLSFFSCGTAGKAENADIKKTASVIPGKILGCRFGQGKRLVKFIMREEILIREKERELAYADVSFAGTQWDHVQIGFNVNNGMQQVIFSRHYKDGSEAMKDYIETAALLACKYIEKSPNVTLDTLKKDESIQGGIRFSSGNRDVTGKIEFNKSVGGEYLWYVKLIYEDKKYTLENFKRAMKEL